MLTELPTELLLMTLRYLYPLDLARFCQTSKRCNKVGSSDWLWRFHNSQHGNPTDHQAMTTCPLARTSMLIQKYLIQKYLAKRSDFVIDVRLMNEEKGNLCVEKMPPPPPDIRCLPILRIALAGLTSTPTKIRKDLHHKESEVPLISTLHQVISGYCIFQERRLYFDSLVQVLYACGSSTMASVFNLILSFELSGHISAKPPNFGLNRLKLPPGMASIVSRGTALSTELFCAFSKFVGSDYLTIALKPLILSIFDSTESFSVLDVESANNEEEANQLRAAAIACIDRTIDLILDALLANVHHFPAPLKNVLLTVRANSNCLPFELEDVDLPFLFQTSFLFSKFILPALLNPEQYGIIKTKLVEEAVPIDKRRKLIVIVKVMANLLTRTRFESLDPEFYPLNYILFDEGKRTKIYQLLDASVFIKYDHPPTTILPRWNVVQAAIQFLHRIIDQNMGHLEQIASKQHFDTLRTQIQKIQQLCNLHSSSSLLNCVVPPPDAMKAATPPSPSYPPSTNKAMF